MELLTIKTQKVVIMPLILCTVAFSAHADDEPIYELEDLVVTASRIPSSFSDLARSVSVIGREEIETAPVQSLPELLEYALGMDVRQRGPFGVQADVSIRGSSFEQVLVLIDGVKVADPQTGHHLLDLPLSLEDIERIEILRGHGSRLYGPNAFGGVINLITRRPAGRSARLDLVAGQHRLAQFDAALSSPLGPSVQRLSLSGRRSDGHREGAEFRIGSVSYSASLPLRVGELDLLAGHMDKEFGAYGFYSAAFPDEWEHTTASFLSLRGRFDAGPISLSPTFSWRRHSDEFVLDRVRPEWYRNRHTTDVYGAEFQASMRWRLGTTAFGGELGREMIESTNLGDHARTRGGVFMEHRIQAERRFILMLGAFAYRYTRLGWKYWPGLDVGVSLTERLRLRASVGRAFRVPTYTDLYYTSPANQGNPDLRSEEAWSYEVGLRWAGRAVSTDMAVFRRTSRNLIDWVRTDEGQPWQAQNIAHVVTDGAEMGMTLLPGALPSSLPVRSLQVSYAFLRSDNLTEGSKYALNHLRHRLAVKLLHRLPFQFAGSWVLRYEQRRGEDAHFLMDGRISRQVRALTLFVEAMNLLDAHYLEGGTAPAPGRWVRAGVGYAFTEK